MNSNLRKEIFIIDDHPIYIDGLIAAIYKDYADEFSVSGSANNIEKAREKLKKSDADIILLDLKLPGENGVVFSTELKNVYPDKKVIALTGETDNDTLFNTWMNGVDAIVMKYSGITELMSVVKKVLEGERIIGKDVPLVFDNQTRSIDKNKPYLSNREKQVLMMLMEGKHRKEVAEKLSMSQETVNTHCKKMFLKFKVNNLQALIHELKLQNLLK